MDGGKWLHAGRREDGERGAVLILVAISMVALIGAAAMGVDVGFTVLGSRTATAMADTAALDLARDVNIADGDATLTASNNYLAGELANVDTDNASNATLSETPGLWLNGAWSVPGSGCWNYTPPATHPCNAIKVTASQSVPQVAFGGSTSPSRTAIAAVTPEAGFSIGSFLASFSDAAQQVPVLNTMLGTLGTSATVTVLGYQGLANTYVTLNQLITASGGVLTPTTIMTTSLTASQWLSIWNDAVSNQVAQLNCGSTPTPNQCYASTALGDLDFGGSTSAKLCQLVTVNGTTCTTDASANLTYPELDASVNVLQMLTTEAELAQGSTNAYNVTSDLGITGVTAANLYIDMIQPPQVSYGVVGATASTAQLQADLQLSILGVTGVLDIPLSAASGTATLKTINCTNNAMTSTKILPTTTAATAAVTLNGSGIATLSISGYNSGIQKTFPGTDVPPTATTAAQDLNPVTVAPNSTTPNWSGLSSSSPAYTVITLLSGALVPVLQAAGVTVAGAEVADLSTNCGAVSLVQ